MMTVKAVSSEPNNNLFSVLLCSNQKSSDNVMNVQIHMPLNANTFLLYTYYHTCPKK